MTESTTPRTADLARKFHEAYERLAPQFGYETREDTRAFDPESPNGKLMIAVCGEFFSEGVDAQDAARYRWLRTRYVGLHFEYGREEDEDGKRAGYPAIVIKIPEKSAWSLPWPGVPVSKFDAAVDAAMKLEPLK